MKQINLYQINWNKVLISVLMLAVIIMASNLFSQCENNKTALATNNALTSQLLTYKLKNGQLATSQKVAFLEKETLQKNIIDKDAELKEMANKFSKVLTVQKVKAKISIPKSEMKFEQPITSKEIDSTGVLKFERKGAYFNKWYEFGYVVTQDSLTIEPFNTWTEIKRVDGFKRPWLFGKKTYHSDITFTNPYINTEQVQTYQVAIPIKWYESRLASVGLGLVAGYLITK